ncbi:predicted protein [Botrytis cinerea T4]|uniref:Uncharacterized protein n=1 Tax=Botryotinia fuckeliana (strain T4) TaxID=999810 RepID=G2YL03_BOTF4|nr:predicted protein [Botrytis cinerea T4]
MYEVIDGTGENTILTNARATGVETGGISHISLLASAMVLWVG